MQALAAVEGWSDGHTYLVSPLSGHGARDERAGVTLALTMCTYTMYMYIKFSVHYRYQEGGI